MPPAKRKQKKAPARSGKLRIADHWNAISIIANSQANPLKAVAEFVENSIDAHAKQIIIIRGKKAGAHFLKISDDGEGIPKDAVGVPDFRRVATHICDSIKRHFKRSGAKGIQGEYGIGLLSFWTVGQKLSMVCCGEDGKAYEMTMAKDSPDFLVDRKRILLPFPGTDLTIHPLLPGLRTLTGEKIQQYLSSELRDRIKTSGVTIKIHDRTGRKKLIVEPRRFNGRLLQHLKPLETPYDGTIYLELYLNQPDKSNQVGLYRRGTRVLPSITELDAFDKDPWLQGYLQGMVDAPFLSLTPGTRHGIIHDDRFFAFCRAIQPVEEQLQQIIADQRKAEEERSSRRILRRVQRALKEAFLRLPQEEYDWFDLHQIHPYKKPDNLFTGESISEAANKAGQHDDENVRPEHAEDAAQDSQKLFFEYAGPLFSVVISPKTSVVSVDRQKTFRAISRDRSKRIVLEDLEYLWEIVDGEGRLQSNHKEAVVFIAPSDPCLITLRVTVRQSDTVCTDEALITVTDSLINATSKSGAVNKGLPGYTYRRAPGEMWRSRFEVDKNVIVINNGHRDFVYAAKNKRRKLRYICRLFCKELVRHNFPGMPTDELLERMIELSLYTEEYLK